MFVSAKVPTETPAAITTSPGEWTRQIIPAILIRLAKTLPARDDPHALQTLMDTVESDSRPEEIKPLDQHHDPTEGLLTAVAEPEHDATPAQFQPMCRSRDNRSIACAHLEPELISTTIRSARPSRRLSTRNRPARPFSSNRPSGSTNIHTSSQAARTDGSAFARAGRAIVDKPNTIKRRSGLRCCRLSHISKSIGTSAV